MTKELEKNDEAKPATEACVAIYASSATSQQGNSLDAEKLAMLRSVASDRGWNVVIERHGTGPDRGGLKALLAQAQSGQAAFGKVLVEDQSRFSRNVTESYDAIRCFRAANIEVVSLAGDADWMRRMLSAMMSETASSDHSRRIKRALAAKRQTLAAGGAVQTKKVCEVCSGRGYELIDQQIDALPIR